MTRAQPLTADQVRDALEQTNGSVTKAAHLLRVDRTTVWRAMQRHAIKVTRQVEATAP